MRLWSASRCTFARTEAPSRSSVFSCSGPPAKAKACDVCANAAFRISTLHRRCLQDVITGFLACILAVKLIRHGALPDISEPPPPWVACCAHQVQSFDLSQTFWCRGLFGFNEQIFGADKQVFGRRRRHLRSVRPYVMQSRKGRILTSIHSA